MPSDVLRAWFELISFGATALTAMVSVYALRQIAFLKRDYDMRVDRSAKEKAIDFSQRYLTRYVELSAIADDEHEAKGLSTYDGTIGDFSAESLTPKDLAQVLQKSGSMPTLTALNELEAIAAAFVSGVADEQLGFSIIGRTFIRTVQYNYDHIAASRVEKIAPYWANIVTLYRTWAPRLNAEELKALRESVTSRLADLHTSNIPPIGRR
jgi:hypothetical protein